MDDKDLKNKLSELEYKVTQEGATEAPYSGKYWDHKEGGKYMCKVCGNPLFDSNVKLNSKEGPLGLRGWPAFEDAILGSVVFNEDKSMGMNRTEVNCAKCGSHLGHIFPDDTATGKHYCINSCSLDFANEGQKNE